MQTGSRPDSGLKRKAAYPKFKSWPPRVLMLTSRYFLFGEVISACKRLGVEHRFIDFGSDELELEQYLKKILGQIALFKPDFVFTVNHLGVDREGVLSELLTQLELPLVSWFVDNPELSLNLYAGAATPLTAIFSWDRDNLETLERMGFAQVRHLPLAVDEERFKPPVRLPGPGSYKARVSFVGNSMVIKTRLRLEAANPSPGLKAAYPELARGFGLSPERSAREYLAKIRPDLLEEFSALGNVRQRAFETLLNWESTRLYRRDCLEKLMEFSPLIVGDTGWLETFAHEGTLWRRQAELSYYDDLPGFYPYCELNFNCTNLQMKGAVNQRVFDVPACGGFLLTDYRAELEELFELGKEVVCYASPEEIPELAAHYLAHPEKRAAISAKARQTILARHTYVTRIGELLAAVRDIFGPWL